LFFFTGPRKLQSTKPTHVGTSDKGFGSS